MDKQLTLLLSNLRHSSLRLKRVSGTRRLWEARVTRGYRLVLEIEGETIRLRRVGTHDTCPASMTEGTAT